MLFTSSISAQLISLWFAIATNLFSYCTEGSHSMAMRLPDFRNPNLPLDKRLDDLLERLTDEELIQQVSHGGTGPDYSPAPEISRLSIKPYQWRTNPLEGDVTPFPQPINQAATFDRRTVYQISLASALELRAKHNDFMQRHVYNDHTGIHLFAPVVNLMRHPLWGRNQETYGEDPFLAGQLARAAVRGLGGGRGAWQLPRPARMNIATNPRRVLLVGANCKHYAAHTGPDDYPVSRLSFEAEVSPADMWFTYFPAFRACLEAGAVGLMCAYSGLNGAPDCANPWLLTTVLRKQWKFPGLVVTDQGALQFLVSQHRAFANLHDAALAAVAAGVNLENAIPPWPNAFSQLPVLLHEGLINRTQLIQMARPLFATRMLQGEFDPPQMDPYGWMKPEMFVQNPQHARLALLATARSIVLLVHRDLYLPLQPASSNMYPPLRKVSILGPFATKVNELYGGYGTTRMPKFEIPLSEGLKQLALNVSAQDICTNGGRCTTYNRSVLESELQSPYLDMAIITIGTGSHVEGENHDRHNLSLPGQQLVYLRDALDMAAGRKKVRVQPVPVIVLVFSSGPLDIQPAMEDDNVKAIFWCGLPGPRIGEAIARLLLGNSGVPFGPNRPFGFDGGMKNAGLDLVNDDEEAEELQDASVVGSSTDRSKVEPEHSMAELVDSEEGYWWLPSGRLPFTWYASIKNLAKITYYGMTNQTYRYLPMECHRGSADCQIPVLFPFGYGLTYNSYRRRDSAVQYSQLSVPTLTVAPGQNFLVSALVTNTGPFVTDEVVQVYTEWKSEHPKQKPSIIRVPRQLVGFQRLALAVGESRRVQFTISATDRLAVWIPDPTQTGGRLIPGTGELKISLGGQQPDQAISAGSAVLNTTILIQQIE